MKNWGGHFTPELGGHFELESGGHFKLELGGQYHRNMHFNTLLELINISRLNYKLLYCVWVNRKSNGRKKDTIKLG